MTPTRSARRLFTAGRRTLTTAVVAALVGGLVAPGAADAVPTAPASRTEAPGSTNEEPLAFEIDPGLPVPRLPLDPVGRLGTNREVGVLAGPDGSPAGLVLDEVLVRTADQAGLDAFLTRWGGQLLDSFPADGQGQDHLVRVDVDRADPANLVADLRAAEPDQSGRYRVGDERALRLLALAAAEWRAGTELVLDWLVEPAGIADGKVFEAPNIKKNVFDWSYMGSGNPMDTGVAKAWQLLQAKGKLTRQVKYLVLDGGFQTNPDLPAKVTLYTAEWGKPNPSNCTNDTPCPWHATDVALAGMGQVDNGYGAAGPAGPVVDELVAVRNGNDYWTKLRRLEKAAEATRPDVVNLSFGRDVTLGKAHARTWTDRRMKHVRDTGALIVSSSGNNGRNIDGDTLYVPCESVHVMCVGGVNTWDATVADKSNYGTSDVTTSVEIYGPMCVQLLRDPAQPGVNEAEARCGTSFAAPFVGGVAALVMAANPDLTSAQVRDILNETAHVGELGWHVTGSQRRINALAAVAKALGVKPSVSISMPHTKQQFTVGQSVDLWGTAIDFGGKDLPLTWTSNLDGPLGTGSMTFVPSLSAGTHVITAKATDSLGQTASATVTVTVVDSPATAAIISPPAGLSLVAGQPVSLVGISADPDTSGPVPDAQTSWTVRRGNEVVFQKSGHQAVLPAGTVVPGPYTVTFTAGGAVVQRAFLVTAAPAGQTRPTATITKPASTVKLSTVHAAPLPVAFTGTGADAEDGAVAGTRYRWTAYGDGGVKKVLCQGSAVPTGGPIDDIVLPKSCANLTGELAPLASATTVTTWSVWLEVFDSTGLVGVDSTLVEIEQLTP
ncbi:S8 family serine peptidase [Micromonospora sp. WMMD882]|uniref:S8/S53 family peptidase n=1 Tax=Micromonospora sp. WMMD882 TaxID=3015151 RepID=UPI00248AB8B5|nr:S8 family serine peptidase [Micromonospora sp. WMMD882]WBB81496.1 S8 family serine peptidase [Micromonospora sp. WMMD882]